MKEIELNSFCLVSLMDILKHDAQMFTTLMSCLQVMEDRLRLCTSTDPLPEDGITNMQKTINTVADHCELLKLSGSLKMISYISDNFHEYNCGQLMQSFDMLQHMVHRELGEHIFLIIPEDRADWLNKPDAFGQEVSLNFNSAKEDILESGNCYAVGLYTACVFHTMRVLEHGLKALAKNVGLKFYRQSWGKIIDKIREKVDDEIKSLNKQQKDPARTEKLQFLSQAAQEFTYFKDGWRNYVMHGEDKYDGPKALSILNHVKTFMAHLATKLTE